MSETKPVALTISGDRFVKGVFWGLVGCEVLLVLIHKFVDIAAFRCLVDIASENSVANWFSSTQLLFVGVLLWLIAIAVKNLSRDAPNRRKVWAWAIIAVFFTYMGVDDATQFHEHMGGALDGTLAAADEAGASPGAIESLYNSFPSYTWQVLYGPFYAVMGLFVLGFVWHEVTLRSQRSLLLGGLALYVAAVALDFAGGLEGDPFEGVADFLATTSKSVKNYTQAIEEFIEMLGTTFLLRVFLKKLLGLSGTWNIRIEAHAPD